ncbi:MAG: DNA primase small subunit domain-containing protein [Acidilobaceae archaeon]
MSHQEQSRVLEFKKWTQNSLKTLYQLYYKVTSNIKPPRDIAKREFAFQPFDIDSYIRHLSFYSFNDLREYLVLNPPRHAYYSIALYELPEAKSMEEKGWLGSEILVDIDVDHLEECRIVKVDNVGELVGDECLLEGFKQALRIKKMLERDFDMNTTVYFSGSRGFHIIGYNESYLTLGRDEREEIAKYISGLELNISYLIPISRDRSKISIATPLPEDPGWRGLIGEILRSRGAISSIDYSTISKIEDIISKLKIPIDMQVTRDPSRLARLIGSLNGKSSLMVVEVEEDQFTPSIVLSPFNGELTVKAKASLDDIKILGLKISFKKGETLNLEAPIALLLASKGIVDVLSGVVKIS